jgi:hypothetical protein
VIIDTARLENMRVAPGGGVIVTARIGRSGVQSYKRPNGTTVRAYRPPAEVVTADYTGAPVTIGHPPGGVTPETFTQLAKGMVRSQDSVLERRGRYEYVKASVQISDAETVKRVGKDLTECSCAYTPQKEWTSGITEDGEEYDVIFRGLVPNHLALGPDGFAKAGRDARLVVDGEDADMDQLSDNFLELVEDGDPPAGDRDKLVAKIATLEAEKGKLVADAAASKTVLETANGKVAALEADSMKMKARVDGLDKEIMDGVSAAIKFRSEITPRLPKDYAFDGKSPVEIKRDAITHCSEALGKGLTEDSSDAYLDGILLGLPKLDEHDHNKKIRPSERKLEEDGKPGESVIARKAREAYEGARK